MTFKRLYTTAGKIIFLLLVRPRRISPDSSAECNASRRLRLAAGISQVVSQAASRRSRAAVLPSRLARRSDFVVRRPGRFAMVLGDVDLEVGEESRCFRL